MKILLLEDDRILSETIAYLLQSEGYDITCVYSTEEAEDATFEKSYDLYLFDINLNDGSGVALLEALRHAEDDTPVIFITALQDLDTMAQSFRLGAIDYVKKPFDPEELLIRVRAKFGENALHYGDIAYDVKNDIVKKNGKIVEMGTVQSAVFVMLLKHCGEVVRKERLYECLEYGSDSALRVAISKIKQRLDVPIRNIRGKGYMLEAL